MDKLIEEINGEDKTLSIVGIVGKAGAGKTTLANFMMDKAKLLAYDSCNKIGFGDGLKQMLSVAGICDMKHMVGKKTKFSRWIMQRIGTDVVRNQIDPDYWTKILLRRILNIKRTSRLGFIVVDDIRFKNEADVIQRCGGILFKIERPETSFWRRLFVKKSSCHISELEQKKIKVKYNIKNNGSLKQLQSTAGLIVDDLFRFTLKKHFNVCRSMNLGRDTHGE